MTCPFRPSPARAATIDRTIRFALADSLATVTAAFPDLSAAEACARDALLAAIRTHAMQPAVFALYAELAEAVVAEQELAARDLMGAILRPELRDWTRPRIVTLAPPHLGPGLPALYVRTLDTDPAMKLRIGPVDAAEMARAETLHAAARDLLHAACPALAGETDQVAHEIVLVRETGGDGGEAGFDGASTFYLWGAVALNSARQHTRTQWAEALTHEAAHAVLFGATLGAPLVENDPAERYASPLRADPRPMEGLVHASFVLARMIWCQTRTLASGLLDEAERAEVAERRARECRAFQTSRGPIAGHARFTPEGRALWTAACDWFDLGCP